MTNLHSECPAIDVEQGLLFLDLRGLLLPQPDDLPNDFDVEPRRFRFAVDVFDIVTECLSLFFQPLDPLNETPEPVRRYASHVGFIVALLLDGCYSHDLVPVE